MTKRKIVILLLVIVLCVGMIPPAPVAASAVTADAALEYIGVLGANSDGIARYFSMCEWLFKYPPNLEKCVSLVDIDNNGIEELLFMTMDEDYSVYLNIYGYFGGNVKSLLNIFIISYGEYGSDNLPYFIIEAFRDNYDNRGIHVFCSIMQGGVLTIIEDSQYIASGETYTRYDGPPAIDANAQTSNLFCSEYDEYAEMGSAYLDAMSLIDAIARLESLLAGIGSFPAPAQTPAPAAPTPTASQTQAPTSAPAPSSASTPAPAYIPAPTPSQPVNSGAEPIIVIPGICGSTLANFTDKKADTVWPSLQFDLLALGSDGVPPANSTVGALNDKYGTLETYKELVLALEKAFPDRVVYFFNYDWRLDNTAHADALSSLIDSLLIDTNSSKVNIVTHSMGGLIAVKYISNGNADKIRNYISIATPYYGSPKAPLIWMTGKFIDWLQWIPGGIAVNEGLRKISSYMPSIYQLLPPENLWGYIGVIDESAMTYEYEEDPFLFIENKLKLVNASGVPVRNDIKSDLLNKAREFRKGLHVPTALSLVNSLVVYSSGKNTIATIGVDADGGYIRDLNFTTGDGTVPAWSANTDGAKKTLQLSNLTHTGIVKDDDCIDAVIDWIRFGGLNLLIDTSIFSRHVKVIADCPVDIEISYMGETLSSAVDNYCSETSWGSLYIIGGNDDKKVVALDTDALLDISFTGTGDGTMDYTIEFFDGDFNLQEIYSIENVPVTPQTVITTNTTRTQPSLNTGNAVLPIPVVSKDVDIIGSSAPAIPSGGVGESLASQAPEPGGVDRSLAPPDPGGGISPSGGGGMPSSGGGSSSVIMIIVLFVAIFAAVIIIIIVKSSKKSTVPASSPHPNADRPVYPPNLSDNRPPAQYGNRPPARSGDSTPGARGGAGSAQRGDSTPGAHGGAGSAPQGIYSSPATPGIEVLTGSIKGTRMSFSDGETLLLGKEVFSNLPFPASYTHVSRAHCAITYDRRNNMYYIVDSSSNGTFIDGVRIEKGRRAPAAPGSTVSLASDDCIIRLLAK